MSENHVAILFGGRSPEHDISIRSAVSVIQALDTSRYEAYLIGIDRQGNLRSGDIDRGQFARIKEEDLKHIIDQGELLSCVPGQYLQFQKTGVSPEGGSGEGFHVDIAFPVLHGAYGEDGSIQGLFRLLDIAYVGPDHMGSSIGMDKDISKRLVRDAGIHTAKWYTVYRHSSDQIDPKAIIQELGLPVFVKPATLGSSVGVYRVDTIEELPDTLKNAFAFDRKVLIESAVHGREIECAVLGNENVEASPAGEIIANHGFYTFEEKYSDSSTTGLVTSASLPPGKMEELQSLAIQIFRILGCEGLSRVDFFLLENGEFYFNEINTIPGFTSISMYPALWQDTGKSMTQLVTDLLELGRSRLERDRSNQTGQKAG